MVDFESLERQSVRDYWADEAHSFTVEFSGDAHDPVPELGVDRMLEGRVDATVGRFLR